VTISFVGVAFAASAFGVLDGRWVALSPIVLVLALGIGRWFGTAGSPRAAAASGESGMDLWQPSRAVVMAAALFVTAAATASVAGRLAGTAMAISLGDDRAGSEFPDERLLAIAITTTVIVLVEGIGAVRRTTRVPRSMS
jgi:hypothetical protein